MRKAIVIISFSVVMFFMLIGLFSMSIFFHELSHANQLKNIVNSSNSYLGILLVSQDFKIINYGFYMPDYNRSDENIVNEFNKIQKRGELKAILSELIFLIPFLFFFYVFCKSINFETDPKQNERKNKN